jgi:preprotein translocase subunit SecD
MAPPASRSGLRPLRALSALAVVLLIMTISVLGKQTFNPGKWQQQFKVGLGLDLSSGTQVVLQAQTPNGRTPSSGSMQQAITVLLSRVNGTGNSGAQVQQVGGDKINVTVPGKAAADVLDLISKTAQLRFRPVLLEAPYNPAAPATSASASGSASLVSAATMKLFNKEVCKPGPNDNTVNDKWKKSVGYTPGQDQYDDLTTQIVSCDANGTKYVLGPAVFAGKDIQAVNAGLLQNSTQWVVDLTVSTGAGDAFKTLTENQYTSYFAGAQSGNQNDAALDSNAVVLDGNVVSAPQTRIPIPAGQIEITGGGPNGFTQAQATDLANVLKYGSLPLSFVPQTVNSISAQLGHTSLDAGLIAAIIGLLLVVIYSFIYYRGLGLVSVSSLLMASLLAYLSVVLLSKYQNFTMSLSAIAGLVVAIGITADSFIVFFERLRDEVRDGKTLRPAVESGWRRARRTILVSDTVSFLAAVLLYHFAVSDVQGFAYTLGLTTLIDVLVVFLFTKPMVTVLAGTKFYGSGHPWSGLDPARLGARAPWRGSTRRTVRTQRTTTAAARPTSASPSTTTRED